MQQHLPQPNKALSATSGGKPIIYSYFIEKHKKSPAGVKRSETPVR